jgi:enoyl-CoA hydratase / 3-hydroxyacyl-CoA dehydrogenase
VDEGMPLTLFGRSVSRIAIIGSGHIGPDIALYFSRVLSSHGVPIVVNDVSKEALEAGRARIGKKLQRATDSGSFRPSDALAWERNVTFTLDKSLLVGAELAIEAATEKLEVKQAIFEELERLLSPTAIVASNSSHLEPERLFEKVRKPERCLVHHFFFPADRNPLVELVPHPRTTVTDWCLKFYERIGKVPIQVKSRYGYAINPIFEGLFLAAALLDEEGLPPAVIDAIASRALGMGAGPFTVMNLTGGSPLTQAGLRQYHKAIMPWFRSTPRLDEKVESRAPWESSDRGDTVSYSNAIFEKASRQLLGAYFGLACEVLESGISNLSDLDMGVEIGLSLKAPFSLMNDLGYKKVKELVTSYAADHPGFKVPREMGPWTIPYVLRENVGDIAVLTVRRPKTLNALNREVYRQLDAQLAAIKEDPLVRGVVLTGFGTKAFVSGADIQMLSAIKSPEEAKKLSRESNQVMLRLETLGKPVVAALNGLSLGGGSELAYACTARVARKGISMLFGQPEVKLGIIPGAGGTQRLPRLIDFSAAWRLLRTGGAISGEDALKLGLVLELVDGDLVTRAIDVARTIKPEPPAPPRVPAVPPEIDLGGLSRKVDEILKKAILTGIRMPLEEALEFESQCFGEVFTTRDCHIGLENFVRTSLKQPAVFTHS